MKGFIKNIILLVALSMITVSTSYAQGASKVDIKVKQLVTKYDDVKGVDCMTVTEGLGLGFIKMMFNKQFGKEFMKGVTAITIIDYSNASEQTCQALHKELDAFLSMLQEFKLDKEKEFANNNFIRCFASSSPDNATISDFLVALENNDSKIIMYMAGKIKLK